MIIVVLNVKPNTHIYKPPEITKQLYGVRKIDSGTSTSGTTIQLLENLNSIELQKHFSCYVKNSRYRRNWMKVVKRYKCPVIR